MTEFLADAAETLFVDAPSARFAYRRLGRPNGVPLVMAMRLRGTIDHWDPAFLDALSADREVIIFDNRGINLSTGTPASSITEMAEGLIEFTTALGLEKFDLFGWSMGGMVVATAALARPELVGHLIFSGSTPGIIEGQPLAPPKVWQVAGRGANTEEDFLFLFYPETESGVSHGRSQLDRLRTRLDVSQAVVSAEAAVHEADIVVTVTNAREPILRDAWIAPGTHINAVGSSTPSYCEIEPALMGRASLFVDRRESTLAESGDYLSALRAGLVTPASLRAEIGELVVGAHPGRVGMNEVTLFKSLGMALEDVATARFLYQRAKATQAGTWLPL